jgi:hypothetical protein
MQSNTIYDVKNDISIEDFKINYLSPDKFMNENFKVFENKNKLYSLRNHQNVEIAKRTSDIYLK